MTHEDLALFFHISKRNMREYCKLLHSFNKIYICSWHKKHYGKPIPVYAINTHGDLEDEERPIPLTPYELKKRAKLLKEGNKLSCHLTHLKK